MRRRGCLLTLGVFAGLTLICCGLLWFVAIPQIRDQVGNDLSDALSTQVSEQIGVADVQAGTYELSVAEIEQQLANTLNVQNVDELELAVDESGFEMSFVVSNTQRVGYTGMPVAQNGELVMENMQVNNEALGFFLPADQMGNAIENGVNGYFSAQGLEITDIQLGDDVLTVETVEAAAGGS